MLPLVETDIILMEVSEKCSLGTMLLLIVKSNESKTILLIDGTLPYFMKANQFLLLQPIETLYTNSLVTLKDHSHTPEVVIQ
jgi:hypothetical protein